VKVTIQNIEPIKNDSIEINDLTVIVGMNNTGKSLFLHAVHALYDETLNFRIMQDFFKHDSKMEDVYREMLINRVHSYEFTKEGLLKVIINLMKYYSTNEVGQLIYNFIFKEDGNEKIIIGRDLLSGEKTNIEFDNLYRQFDYLVEETYSKDIIGLRKKKNSFIFESTVNNDYYNNKYHGLVTLELKQELSDFFARLFSKLSLFSRQTISFPSERSGLMLSRTAKYQYPNAMTEEYVSFLNAEMDTNQLAELKFRKIAEYIENKILFGKIVFDPNGNVQFKDHKTNNKISMNRVSSSVRELSGIILYLKYSVKSGHTILIDEPELSLHPNAIRYLVRAIAMLLKSKLKIVIITHSDYFVKELNNLINLSDINVKKNKVELSKYYDEKYITEISVNKEDVSIYSFTRDNEGQVLIKKDLVCDEYGFYEPLFDKTIVSLNETEDFLYNLKHDVFGGMEDVIEK